MNKKEQLINELILTYLKKNKDYGNSATETFTLFGEQSYLIRLHDKLKRIERLLHSDAEVQEKIDDTILDLIVYDALFVKDTSTSKAHPIVTILDHIDYFLTAPRTCVTNIVDDLPTGFKLNENVIDYIENYIKVITR